MDKTSDSSIEIIERLTVLETRIAFQDQTIEALSGVVAAQQEQIDQLIARLRKVVEQVDTGLVEKREERPPHY